MNANIAKLALDAGLINYVDLETPRRYFIHGNADIEEVEQFAIELISEVVRILTEGNQLASPLTTAAILTEHFDEE